MRTINFNTLEDAFNCYGRDNLIAIDNLKQVIFYTSKGCQPKFVFENEKKPGKVTFWFLKCETNYVYKEWMNNRPVNSYEQKSGQNI